MIFLCEKYSRKNNLFQVVHTHVEPHHVIRKRAADQSLRILLYYDESVYRWAIYYYYKQFFLNFNFKIQTTTYFHCNRDNHHRFPIVDQPNLAIAVFQNIFKLNNRVLNERLLLVPPVLLIVLSLHDIVWRILILI